MLVLSDFTRAILIALFMLMNCSRLQCESYHVKVAKSLKQLSVTYGNTNRDENSGLENE